MIASMTGYGKQELELPGKKITVEIRSLNSKQLDLNTRLPSLYREKELELRSMLGNQLERGKIDLTVFLEYTGEETNYSINRGAVLGYYQSLLQIDSEMESNHTDDFLGIIMKLPEVVKPEKEELDEDEWKSLMETVMKTVKDVQEYRANEGKVLLNDFRKRKDLILAMLSQIEPFEATRVSALKTKLMNQLKEFDEARFDENRLEQELIYYLEKLDVTEEKVRLKNHCDYFDEILEASNSQGKKLGFIIQEMGREINTLGSKANQSDIQKIVVNMKDELEKIKEQLMNIL